MKSLVTYDSRVHRYRFKGKFISKTKAKSMLKQTRKLVVITKSGKYRIRSISKRKKKISRTVSRDSEIFRDDSYFRLPYKIMSEGNMNMSEFLRYEEHLRKNLFHLISSISKKRKVFFSTSVYLMTNKGGFFLSSRAYEYLLDSSKLINRIVDDILSKIESICMKSSIKYVKIQEAFSTSIRQYKEVITV